MPSSKPTRRTSIPASARGCGGATHDRPRRRHTPQIQRRRHRDRRSDLRRLDFARRARHETRRGACRQSLRADLLVVDDASVTPVPERTFAEKQLGALARIDVLPTPTQSRAPACHRDRPRLRRERMFPRRVWSSSMVTARTILRTYRDSSRVCTKNTLRRSSSPNARAVPNRSPFESATSFTAPLIVSSPDAAFASETSAPCRGHGWRVSWPFQRSGTTTPPRRISRDSLRARSQRSGPRASTAPPG